jgi:hypothetical protein
MSEVLAEMVQRNALTIKEIAERIGKPYPTLLRELNPFDEYAKVGVDLFLPLMLVCGDDQPLHHLASRLGYRLVSETLPAPSAPTIEAELLDNAPAYAHYQTVMADPASTAEQRAAARRELDRELDEDEAAARRIHGECLERAHEGAKGGIQ